MSKIAGPPWGPVAPNLDLLRSFAVLCVVLSHLPPLAQLLPDDAYHLHSLGIFGVDIFFVHTCLVLMLSQERTPGARGFFIRRAFRIYPLSLVVVALTHALTRDVDVATTISNLLLVQNLTGHPSLPPPLWSLPFEVQMYLVLPLLFWWTKRSGALATQRLLLTFAVAVAVPLLLHAELFFYVPCFLAGVVAYSSLGAGPLPPWLLFAYVLAAAAVFPLLVALGGVEHVMSWPLCLGLGLLVARTRQLASATLARVGAIVAKYSYGIYLCHFACIELAFGRFASPFVQWPVFLGSLTAAAFLAYHLIERPGIELGKKIAGRAKS